VTLDLSLMIQSALPTPYPSSSALRSDACACFAYPMSTTLTDASTDTLCSVTISATLPTFCPSVTHLIDPLSWIQSSRFPGQYVRARDPI
jgi:hypothetical protein